MTHLFREPTWFSAPRPLPTMPNMMEYTIQNELGNHERETEVDEMPGGCLLDTHDDTGEQDILTGGEKSDVGKGKQRMVTCEEVEDEDMVRRPKVNSTDEKPDESDEDEFFSFGEDEDEQEDGDGDELEDENNSEDENESEDETEDEDKSEDEDESEDNKNELEHRRRMLWTCEICNTTLNIFAREDHLGSRAHLRNTRGKIHAAYDDSAPSYTWRCTLCAEDMSVFHRADHLGSKLHHKSVLQHRAQNNCSPLPGDTTPEEFADLPALDRSSSFDLRKTFYCITCAAEFDFSEQAQHLATSVIWNCEVCATHMHPVVRAQHLDSEAHAVAKRRSKAPEEDIFCGVCEQVYTLGEEVDHLAGTGHRTMLARRRLEKLYREQKLQAQLSRRQAAGKEQTAAETDAQQSKTKKHARPSSSSYCEVCNKHVNPSGMVGHRMGKKHMRKEAANQKPSINSTRRSQATSWAIPSAEHITVSGGKFHCAVCSRDRHVVGMEGHMNSKRHREKMAATRAN